jgi:predicted TIM-barrel fold metal-dependent hydrolase
MGPYHTVYLPAGELDRMLHSVERCGVRKIVCAHHLAMAYDVRRGNALMQQLLDDRPDQFLGYWVMNPNYPDIIEEDLQAFDQWRGFVGFKFWSDYHLVPLTSPKYARALRYAHDHEFLVMVHTWGGSEYDAPHLLAEVADRYTNARFLMAHCGYGEWERAIGYGRDLPNVYLDLTSVAVAHDFSLMPGGSLMPTSMGSPQVNGLIEYMVETAGSHKMVFGSDLPWYSQLYQAGAVLFARISDRARHDILHCNAEKLLGTHLDSRPASPVGDGTYRQS